MWRTVAKIEASLRAFTGCADPPTGDLAELQGIVSKLLAVSAHELADAGREAHRIARTTSSIKTPPKEIAKGQWLPEHIRRFLAEKAKQHKVWQSR